MGQVSAVHQKGAATPWCDVIRTGLVGDVYPRWRANGRPLRGWGIPTRDRQCRAILIACPSEGCYHRGKFNKTLLLRALRASYDLITSPLSTAGRCNGFVKAVEPECSGKVGNTATHGVHHSPAYATPPWDGSQMELSDPPALAFLLCTQSTP